MPIEPYQDDRCTQYDDPERDGFIAETRKLVVRWYDKADSYKERGMDTKYHATRQCADQLAKTIEEYGGERG